MRSADFDYPLPQAAIAQQPPARRDRCRLAVLDRGAGTLRHRRFGSLPGLLRQGDLLVFNDSRVLPVRIPCRRASGGAVEVFLLETSSGARDVQAALLRPLAKLKPGERLDCVLAPGGFEFLGRSDGGAAGRVRWTGPGALLPGRLAKIGLTPTPPYIQRPDPADRGQRRRDRRGYQTVYARHGGSVAAPTAGLHFTRSLLSSLKERGIRSATVTLHVGLGTFQPVQTERLEDHPMHAERYIFSPECAREVASARRRGNRVIAVGTTALRALESGYGFDPGGSAQLKETRLFVMPGHSFRVCTGLLTNFHQPRSTLLPLVCAFAGSTALVLKAYRDCLRLGYRFLSYGDAILLL